MVLAAKVGDDTNRATRVGGATLPRGGTAGRRFRVAPDPLTSLKLIELFEFRVHRVAGTKDGVGPWPNSQSSLDDARLLTASFTGLPAS